MRRLFYHHSVKNSRQPSPCFNSDRNLSRNSQRHRGHSLMRRTELSWEKLQRKTNEEPKHPKPHENRAINDYLVRNQAKNKETNRKETAKKMMGKKTQIKNRPRLRRKQEDNRSDSAKRHLGFEHQALHANSIKNLLAFRRPNSQKVQSMKSINTTDTRKDFFDSSYASNYQIENIFQKATAKENPEFVLAFDDEPYQIKPQVQPHLSASHSRKDLPQPKSSLPEQSRLKSILGDHRLASSSILSRGRSCLKGANNSIAERVNLHLQILGQLAQYSKSMIQMYQNVQDWEELIFLVYKKYYLERVKALDHLKGHTSFNPFALTVSPVTSQEIRRFRGKQECRNLIMEVQTQNKQIVLVSLRNFYNLIIAKSGPYVNLDEVDNFSSLIFSQMDNQINILKEISQGNNGEVQQRLSQIFRTAFLISELNGRLVMSYEQSLEADEFGSFFHRASHLFQSLLNT